MTIPKYISDMMEGFKNKDPRYVDLSNHMGKSEEKILTEIPYGQLGKLETLKFLSIKNNRISKIDAQIGALTALDGLELSERHWWIKESRNARNLLWSNRRISQYD